MNISNYAGRKRKGADVYGLIMSGAADLMSDADGRQTDGATDLLLVSDAQNQNAAQHN